MKKYLRNWNMTRVLRLVLGLVVIVQSIMDRQWVLAGFGALFALMPLLDMGCCSTSGCRIPNTRGNKKSDEELIYEEVR